MISVYMSMRHFIRTCLVTQVCKAHNRVIVSFLQQVQGGTRSTIEGSRENIGHNVHV